MSDTIVEVLKGGGFLGLGALILRLLDRRDSVQRARASELEKAWAAADALRDDLNAIAKDQRAELAQARDLNRQLERELDEIRRERLVLAAEKKALLDRIDELEREVAKLRKRLSSGDAITPLPSQKVAEP